ncbi:hypothetical protein [Streptomyces brasiliensis]|uniref:Uncharacterized protein n=1 Tax=Streptomyces brasiliensis TaxID=1954 RepID=A0A917NSE2_9ACTN|nr:hypothetical protein [Streptomyces brasiliensis]GGJ23314.1 hypothetical protein GCM10010121_037900 [Streptomyces brasiliensis]
MPEHVSILHLMVVAGLVLTTAAWVIFLRILHRARREAVQRSGHPLHALAHQRLDGPHREAVELTPAEQDAFAGLVRRLGDR